MMYFGLVLSYAKLAYILLRFIGYSPEYNLYSWKIYLQTAFYKQFFHNIRKSQFLRSLKSSKSLEKIIRKSERVEIFDLINGSLWHERERLNIDILYDKASNNSETVLCCGKVHNTQTTTTTTCS